MKPVEKKWLWRLQGQYMIGNNQKSGKHMKGQEVKKAVSDNVEKINELLTERADIVNHIPASDFNIQKSAGLEESGSGFLFEPFDGVSIEFAGPNITVKGKDEKFQQTDTEVQQLLNSALNTVSAAQDSLAKSTSEKA